MTAEEIISMVVELETGKPPSLRTPEADKFRENLKREIAEIKRSGYQIDIPFEIPGLEEPRVLGGPGSGFFGHAGRPGKLGGSAPTNAEIMAQPPSAYPPVSNDRTMMEVGPGGVNSLQRFTRADGTLTPERQALHNAIVAESLKGHKPAANPVANLMGGGGASGKSVMQAELQFPEDRVHVDVDIIRTQLPEWKAESDAAARENRDPSQYTAQFTHEEASLISKKIIDQAAKAGMNLTVDGAGDTSIEKVEQNVRRYSAAGQKVIANYVTVDYDVAYARMRARGDSIQANGRKYGRYTAASHLRAVHASVANVFPEAVRRGLFDEFTLWDTTDSKPIPGQHNKFTPALKVASGKGKHLVIHDQAAWDRFIERGKGISPRAGEI